jgi:hypothetical protein
VIGGEALGDEIGIDELVALLAVGLLEADGEGLEVLLALLGEEPDDDARIDAAREQHADRHVGDHAALDGAAQLVEHHVAPVLERRSVLAACAVREPPEDGRP